ncbi:MAG: hypothetical protein IH629_02980 [Thermoleophilia bacterium]|nr:hypothetical protein [Thermoleophilia bacterium]
MRRSRFAVTAMATAIAALLLTSVGAAEEAAHGRAHRVHLNRSPQFPGGSAKERI